MTIAVNGLEVWYATIAVWLFLQFRKRILLKDNPSGYLWPTHCKLRFRTHSWESVSSDMSECRRCESTKWNGTGYE